MSKKSTTAHPIKVCLPNKEYDAAVREAALRGLTVAALTLLMFRAAAAEFFTDF